jgi:hypothetical protein
MEDIDVWRSAHQFMKMHASEATQVAFNFASARIIDGDVEEHEIWTRM